MNFKSNIISIFFLLTLSVVAKSNSLIEDIRITNQSGIFNVNQYWWLYGIIIFIVIALIFIFFVTKLQIVRKQSIHLQRLAEERNVNLFEINKKLEERQHEFELQTRILKDQTRRLKEANNLLTEQQKEITLQSKKISERNIQIENEKNLLRTLIDNMPDFIYIKDTKSRFIIANKYLRQVIHKNKPDSIIGKTDYDYYEKEKADIFFNDEKMIIKTGKPLINKVEKGIDEDGKECDLLTTKVPLKDRKGKIIGIVGIGRNITEQINNEKKMKEQAEKIRFQARKLKQNNKQLKGLNATKDRFFSIIAHDLKSPVNSILGFSYLLKNKFSSFDEERKKQFIDLIYDSTDQMYKLLEDLLIWSRSQIDSIRCDPCNFNIEEIVNKNVELLIPSIERKNNKIKFHIRPNTNVFADKDMINTVIRNLISNANKFTEEGDISISTIPEENNRIKICISDTGVGIDQNQISKLFKIEESISTKGTSGEVGTGLGLIICKDFIHKNNGEIWAESIPGKGSTFSVSLPESQN